jgi:AmmeMemoRadiSam system protein B
MTHYESAARAAQKDRKALDAVEALDGGRLLDICRRHGVTMCGRAPAAVVVEAARQLGATSAAVVDYRHSGWVSGDESSVVAYAGVVVG